MLDASGIKTETDVKGRQPPDPGTYHGVVQFADASYEKHNAVIVDLEVLAGTPTDQKGRVLRHMAFLDEEGNYSDRHLRLALATGIIEPGQAKDVEWQDTVGRQVIFQVERRPGKDKEGEPREYLNVAHFGLAIWSVGNPEVADVPKDEAALKLLQSAAPAAASAASAADPYADI